MSSTGWRTSRRGKASAASKQSVNSGSQPKTSKSGASKAEDDVPVNYGNKKTATMLSTVLDKCQKSRQAFHPSAMTVKKYIQGDPKTLTAVCKSFCHFLERCLPVYKKSDPVDRIIEFLGQLCKHLDSPLNDHFGIEIVAHTVQFWNSKDKGVRLRVCQIIASVLENLSEEAEISDVLWSKLVDKMKQRTFDKIAQIRVQAVRSVERLQDITDPNCPIVKRLCQIMEHDASKDVRAAAVDTVALTGSTLQYVLRRTKDVDKTVRVSAIRNINERVACMSLSTEQRIALIQTIFSDRDKQVKQAAYHMIVSWLARCQFSLSKFLGLLDVVSNFQICKTIVDEFAKLVEEGPSSENIGGTTAKQPSQAAQNKTSESQLSVSERFCGLQNALKEKIWVGSEGEMDESELVDFCKSLSPQTAVAWMCLVANVAENCKLSSIVGQIDDLVPTLSQICFIIFSLCDEPEGLDKEDDYDQIVDIAAQRQFIIECLLNIAEYCDFQDEMGRQRFIMLVKELMGHQGPTSDDNSSSMLSLMLLGSEDAGLDGIGAPWLWQQSSDHKRMAHLGQIGVGIAVEGAPLLFGFMKTLRKMVGDREDFVRLVVDILEDLFDFAEGTENEEEELSEVRRKAASESENYTRWVRALHITAGVLKLSDCTLQTPELADLIPNVILPGVTSEFCAIRTLAMYSLGLAVMIGDCGASDSSQNSYSSLGLAKQHLPLVVTAIEKDEMSVQMICLQILSDWMMMFNPLELSTGASATFPIEFLLSYLSPSRKQRVLTIVEPRVHGLVAEATAKLLFTGRLNNVPILKRRALAYLLRSYFTPSPEFSDELQQPCTSQNSGEEDELTNEELAQIVKTKQSAEMRMRQSLGTFFVAFSKMSVTNQVDLVIASAAAIRLLATEVALSNSIKTPVDVSERTSSLYYALQFIGFLTQFGNEHENWEGCETLTEHFGLPHPFNPHEVLSLVIAGTLAEQIPENVSNTLAESLSKFASGNETNGSIHLMAILTKAKDNASCKVTKTLSKFLKNLTFPEDRTICQQSDDLLRQIIANVDTVAFQDEKHGNETVNVNSAGDDDDESDDEDIGSFSPAKKQAVKSAPKNRASMGMAFVQSQVDSFQRQDEEDVDVSSDDGSFISANEEETQARSGPSGRSSKDSHVGPSGRNSMSLDPNEIENALAEL